jgi:outer membrane lipoprotein-sorting protein
MKARALLLLIGCLVQFCPGALAGAPRAADNDFSDAALRRVLSAMERQEQGIKDLSADVVQTKLFRDFDDTTVFKGIFRYKKPRRLYWAFYSPDESIIVVNEREALMYVPEMKQVQKLDVTKSPKGVSLIFGFDRSVSELKEEFEITIAAVEPAGGRKRYVLNLQPKTAAAKGMFSRIRLWVPDTLWLPQKVMVYELGGDETTTELFNVRMNTGVPEKMFHFTPPEDAEIVNVDSM